jgi:hypothetical protein
MALDFPTTPTVGQLFPPGSGLPGIAQWKWDGTKWNTTALFMRIKPLNAYNDYSWPTSLAPFPGAQLTDLNGDGVLTWSRPGGPFVELDDISAGFDSSTLSFNLTRGGVPYFPTPDTNLMVFLGGVHQIMGPGDSYTIVGDRIDFVTAPMANTSFYAYTILVG